MSFLDRVEHHTYINVCVELGKSLMGTKQLLEKTKSGRSVALVYQWHRRFSEDSSATQSLKMTGRHTVIRKSLTLNWRLNSLQHGARLTVRGIALVNSITVASAHKILTEDMYMISEFSVIWECNQLHGVFIEKEWLCHNRITPLWSPDVTLATS